MSKSEGWEDEIDVDDSDLQSLHHPLPLSKPLIPPPLHPCSQIPRSSQILTLTPDPAPPSSPPPQPPQRDASAVHLIPGPAGAVQSAMHRRAAAATYQPRISSCFEGEGREDLVDDEMCVEDGDFELNPWISAMNFLGPDSAMLSPISSIKARRSTAERVPQVVGIVSSFVPNGMGDHFITLKDPTGTIGASVHRKVFSENYRDGDISVGCVLVLKQVVVFCPARSARYLNVTPNNVVKIIGKDCGPLDKQLRTSLAPKCSSSGAIEKELPGRQIAADEASRGLDVAKTINGEHTEIRPELAERAPLARDRDEAITDNDVPRGILSCEMTTCSRTAAPTGSMAAPSTKEASKAGLIRTSEPKMVVSKVSMTQWTDEQLSQLFTDY